MDQQRIGFPNFLAAVFQKQEISQQVVTRMKNLASELSKIFPRVIPPSPHSARGRPPPAPNTQLALWPGAGHKRPGVGTQTLVPLNFSAVVAPLSSTVKYKAYHSSRASW